LLALSDRSEDGSLGQPLSVLSLSERSEDGSFGQPLSILALSERSQEGSFGQPREDSSANADIAFARPALIYGKILLEC
jgi:hypothetical protein